MKRILLVFALVPLRGLAAPEKILPKTLELKSIDWYSQQAKAWSEETNCNRSQAARWFNYYAASYFSRETTAQLIQVWLFPSTLRVGQSLNENLSYATCGRLCG
jgi:hypothetical protein